MSVAKALCQGLWPSLGRLAPYGPRPQRQGHRRGAQALVHTLDGNCADRLAMGALQFKFVVNVLDGKSHEMVLGVPLLILPEFAQKSCVPSG